MQLFKMVDLITASTIVDALIPVGMLIGAGFLIGNLG